MATWGWRWEDAWKCSPPEWWSTWSFKYGKKKRKYDGASLNENDVVDLRKLINEGKKGV